MLELLGLVVCYLSTIIRIYSKKNMVSLVWSLKRIERMLCLSRTTNPANHLKPRLVAAGLLLEQVRLGDVSPKRSRVLKGMVFLIKRPP